jgi:murein L,D-transpeptidase YafK
MKFKRIHFLSCILLLAVALIPFRGTFRGKAAAVVQSVKGRKTVAERLKEFGEAVRQRVEPHFKEAGVSYPPDKILLVGLKQERVLELWGGSGRGEFSFIQNYPFTAASGVLGPKLREGDMQVPEGLYEIESLNPNSSFHVALRVGYPNKYDREKGKLDGREQLGSDIMIHGAAVSG